MNKPPEIQVALTALACKDQRGMVESIKDRLAVTTAEARALINAAKVWGQAEPPFNFTGKFTARTWHNLYRLIHAGYAPTAISAVVRAIDEAAERAAGAEVGKLGD